MADVIVGLPSLSQGPLLEMARELKAPVMISSSALARWQDDGPVPPGHEFTLLERDIRRATGDTRPPTAAQRRRRVRLWKGWNTAALDRVQGTGVEVHVDSAGFTAMALKGGYDWTSESYVLELCTHPAIHRFSSQDLCVEPEVAPFRAEVHERIAKTINLNRLCARLAADAGIEHKLMPVIQGATAEDYMRCYDAISSVVRPGATIGVGSMCRRPTKGPDGSIAILERLDRELPRDVRLHLFGIKSDGAEAACMFGERIDTVDSQAYGIRARRIANDRRAADPSFSKSNAFTAGIMREWYLGQKARMNRPRTFALQSGLDLGPGEPVPATILDALETAVRAQFNELIADESLPHDQIIGGRMLEESVFELASELPCGVRMTDVWKGSWQLPEDLVEQSWFPQHLTHAA